MNGTACFKLEKQGRTYSKLSKVLSERKEREIMINQAGGSMKDKDKEKAAALDENTMKEDSAVNKNI
jgi:hypothetical protein